MARRPRIIVPGIPLHLTQRGVDRCPTFLSAEDFAAYRLFLRQALSAARCRLHAYVLMPNHVHLLLTPDTEDGPATLVRAIGSRYVRYFNARYRRTGGLWEGRYHSVLVDSVAYLLRCSRYIERNPVRAFLVADPAAYQWSSYRRNAHGFEDPCVEEHPAYTELAATGERRAAAYRAMFEPVLAPEEAAEIRASQRRRSALFRTPYREAVATVYGERWDGCLDRTLDR